MICYKCLQTIDISNNSTKHGLHTNCFNDWFKLDAFNSNGDFENLALRSGESTDSNHNAINTSFFAGAFKKYSARLNGKMYILKVIMQPLTPSGHQVYQLTDTSGLKSTVSISASNNDKLHKNQSLKSKKTNKKLKKKKSLRGRRERKMKIKLQKLKNLLLAIKIRLLLLD